jgi:hypothetical protein
MHETLVNDVVGHIQEYKMENDKIRIIGWCFHKTHGLLPTRLVLDHDVNIFENKDEIFQLQCRKDVSESYNNHNIEDCGFIITVKDSEKIDNFKLEMIIDGQWRMIFNFLFYDTNEKYVPSFIVVDDFYKYPDNVREFALQQNFHAHPDYHKGKRTDMVFRFPNLKSRFESILGCKIKNWREHGVNCCFQSCIAGDQLVYHVDTQQYAGIIYLTPDAPPECGTTFYRSKTTKNMKINNDGNIVFRTGLLDETQFDVVDVVGNKYNRLVLFDAQTIHAASDYFGNSIDSGRLFQMFFFDLV